MHYDPLSRPLVSSGDETDKDTTVSPSLFNVTYARPYLISLPESFADGKLSLLGKPGGGGNGPTNLGGISPAAGGDHPAKLSPSAGGPNAAQCANDFLGDGWSTPGSQCKE